MANIRKATVDHSHQPDEQPETAADTPVVEVLQIEGDLPGNFVLSAPVRVEVWVENGEHVVDVADLNLHAFGTRRDEAIANVRVMLVEQHQRVEALRGRLSPSMRRDAERLTAIVLPRHA